MATASISYQAAQTLVTTALATLATDANLLAGWASDAVDNTAALGATGSNLATDVFVGGSITASGTAPTTGKQIEVWAYGSWDGAAYSGGVPGTQGTVTFASEKTSLRLLAIYPTDATASHVYEIGPHSIAAAFGGSVPPKWGIYIVHNMGQAFAAATLKFRSVNYTSA